MKLPDNWKSYKGLVLEKTKVYCSSNIWPYSFDRFAAWLNNFEDELDEYVALQFLDALVVKSKAMMLSGYSRLLTCEIRQFLIEENILKDVSIQNWHEKLVLGYPGIPLKFSPIRINGDNGESGSTIYRQMSPLLETERLSISLFDNQDIEDFVIILIDDFVGSGEQFQDYAKKVNLNRLSSKNTIIFCPLMAMKTGVAKIIEAYPHLNIIPVETLLPSQNIFYSENKNAFFRNDRVNTIHQVKTHFVAMQKKYAPKLGDWLGRDDSGLCLALDSGCPNQTLPIFWMSHSNGKKDWNTLFSRRS